MTHYCSICHHETQPAFQAKVLNKYLADYFYCETCGFLQVDSPHWLKEAYSNAIVDADTGLLSRNIMLSQKVSCLLANFFDKDAKYIDVGGGYGVFTRLMRDVGFDFYWSDLYCENLFAKGFEADTQTNSNFTAITAFELLEHLQDPFDFIQKSLNKYDSSTFIFSTELFQGTPPQPDSWKYYAFYSGQHISFFQNRTLAYIANKLSLNFYSSHGIHVFTDKTIKNQFLLNALLSKYSQLFFKIVKNKMNSRIITDNVNLSQNIFSS